jgi:hypothetical protein
MRKSTLGSLLILLIFVPSYFSPAIAAFAGFPDVPSGTARAVVALAAVIFAVFVLTILTLLNPRILSWRKERGRDIEDEERYESRYGMIGLMPKDKDNLDR